VAIEKLAAGGKCIPIIRNGRMITIGGVVIERRRGFYCVMGDLLYLAMQFPDCVVGDSFVPIF
jgi:hypothetical protein